MNDDNPTIEKATTMAALALMSQADADKARDSGRTDVAKLATGAAQFYATMAVLGELKWQRDNWDDEPPATDGVPLTYAELEALPTGSHVMTDHVGKTPTALRVWRKNEVGAWETVTHSRRRSEELAEYHSPVTLLAARGGSR